MTAEIRITIDPGSPGVAKLEKLIQQAENKAGLLKNIGEALLETTRQRFKDQKDPQGRAWAPLKPLTIELRGAAGPILWRSGHLQGDSLSAQIEGDALRIGPSAIYGAVHQFGATIEGKKGPLRIPLKGGGAAYALKVTIPARPYVGFGPDDEKAATETSQDWFDLDE